MISSSRRAGGSTETQDSKILRALSDTNRRHILTIIDEKPGLSVNEITARLPISRWGVRKHLNVLEAAGLVRSEWDGVYRRLYINRTTMAHVLKRLQRRFGT